MINSKENSNQIDLVKQRKKHNGWLVRIRDGMLPHVNDDDPNHTLITKTRFDVFKQDDEKARQKQLKDQLF